jgi:hypothetical protein
MPAQQRLVIGAQRGGHGSLQIFSTLGVLIVESDRATIGSASRDEAMEDDTPR